MTKTSKHLTWIVPAVVLSIIIVWFWENTETTPAAPDITFPLIDGRQLAMKSLSGSPVLVTFWATTCIECLKEIPHLISLYNDLSASGFEIIGVAMPYDPPDRVLATSTRRGIPYPVALDIEGEAVQAFGNVAVTPTSFLISPEGRIVMHHSGVMDMDKLKADIINLLPDKSQVTSYKL